MSDFRSTPPEIHPEFGYFWPSGRARRRIRVVMIALAGSGALAIAAQVPRLTRYDADVRAADLTDGRAVSVSDRSPRAVTDRYALAPFPNYRRKHRAPDDHPYARVIFGTAAARAVDRTPDEIASRAAPGLAANVLAENGRFRTVTVRDGRGGAPRVFVVPVEEDDDD